MQPAALRLTSPAKVNLYLHVTGKRDDGYHLLDSMAVFVDCIHDRIDIKDAGKFSFHVTGTFANRFSAQNLSADAASGNLVVRAAKAYGAATGIDPKVAITLEKNIPMGAGLGGGSGDAAATVRGLEQFYGVSVPPDKRNALILSLGADVPVCDKGAACRFEGIGEIMTPCAPLPKTPILLVWPGVPSLTKDVFAKLSPDDFGTRATWPDDISGSEKLISFLRTTQNSLTRAAQNACPIILEAIQAISKTAGCTLSRMSGSGSCAFGLYGTPQECEAAAQTLTAAHPDWWIKQGTL